MLPGDVRPRLCEKGPGAHRGARRREPACRHHQRVARYPGSGGCRLRYGRRNRCGQRHRPRAPGAALRKRHGPSGKDRKRGRHLRRSVELGAARGLRGGPEPYASHGRHGAFLQSLVGGGFRQALVGRVLYARRPFLGRSGGSDACAGGGSVGPCPFGGPASQAYRRGA